MKALILAAGMATRLRPLTDNTPKCLLTLGGRTLLGRALDALKAAGLSEVVIVTGFMREKIEEFVRENYADMSVEFIHNEPYASTNNIYSLWLARPAVDGESVLLLDSDILFDPRVIVRLQESSFPSCLAMNDHPLGQEEIKVVADGEGYVAEIGKTCEIEASVGESIGIEKMSAEYVGALYEELGRMIGDEGLTGIFYEAAFERLIPQGHRFGIVDTTDLLAMELDTVEDFRHAETVIAERHDMTAVK